MQDKLSPITVPQPPEIYQAVLICGKNIQLNDSLKKRFQQKGWLLIGDGSQNLSALNLDVLKNKIDANTIIYINAHGSTAQGYHFLDGAPNHIATQDLLAKLGSYSREQQALNIHLFSCYGGTAAPDVASLPSDSMLVTHGIANLATASAVSQKTMLELSSLPTTGTTAFRQQFFNNFAANTKQTATASILRKDGSVWQKTMRPPDAFLTNTTDIIRYLTEQRNDMMASYNRNFQSFSPLLTSPEEITETQADSWRNDIFVYMILINDQRLLEALTRNIAAFKDFLDPMTLAKEPLHLAANKDHHKIVAALLSLPQIDVSLKDKHGRTALMTAAFVGHKATVDVLLKSGKLSEDTLNQTSNQGFTAFGLAVNGGHYDIVLSFLQLSVVDINFIDKFGLTALMLAAFHGFDNIVEALIKSGKMSESALELQDPKGRTASQIAAAHGHPTIEKLLQSQAQLLEFKRLWQQVYDLHLHEHLDRRLRLGFELISGMTTALDLDPQMSIKDLVAKVAFLVANAPLITKINEAINNLEQRKAHVSLYSTPQLNNYLTVMKKQLNAAVNEASTTALETLASKMEYRMSHNAEIEKVDGLLRKLKQGLAPEDEMYEYVEEVSERFVESIEQNLPLQDLIVELTEHAKPEDSSQVTSEDQTPTP